MKYCLKIFIPTLKVLLITVIPYGVSVYYNRNDFCFIVLMHVKNIIINKNLDYKHRSPVDFVLLYITVIIDNI